MDINKLIPIYLSKYGEIGRALKMIFYSGSIYHLRKKNNFAPLPISDKGLLILRNDLGCTFNCIGTLFGIKPNTLQKRYQRLNSTPKDVMPSKGQIHKFLKLLKSRLLEGEKY
jgi:hypothetical protein